MKELGKLKYFLWEIKIPCLEYATSIPRKYHVHDLLKETRKLGCKVAGERPIIEKSQYQRLVGKLIYLSHTRPNIAYAISVVSQFMHDPRERHPQAVERIL
ncbi:putative mitochondrial protein, partial [Mucuna pruriens]